MNELIRQSALQDSQTRELLHYVSGEMGLHVVDNMTKVKFQLRSNGASASGLISSHLGFVLPDNPLQAANTDPVAFWCAPDEWIFVGNNVSAWEYRKELSSILADQTFVITDVSDSLTIIELSGHHVLELLAEGCGADLCGDKFTAGNYLLTRFANLPVIIHRLDSDFVTRVYVDRSVSGYLWDWLQQRIAKSEF